MNVATNVVLIDNGSTVDPGDAIRHALSDVDYVRLDTNVGYAAACNLGAQRALSRGSEFILFLNNDTVVEQNVFEVLVAGFFSDPSIGIVSPIIYDMTDSQRIDYALSSGVGARPGTAARLFRAVAAGNDAFRRAWPNCGAWRGR